METQDGLKWTLSVGLAASLLSATSAGAALRLVQDGKDDPGCTELGGETHACGTVALTPNYSFAVTLAGLNVRDVQTGKLLWCSPGFAPRACVNPALANGRIFWTSAASGVHYCWEPVK